MPKYMLEITDPALWRRIKAKCAEEGISIKDKLLSLLKEWLKDG